MRTPVEPDALRYGIIGTGLMGLEHLRNLHAVPGAIVTAIADPDESSLRGALTESDNLGSDRPVAFADYAELLESDHCDAVVVATPNMTHVDILADVLAAGLHVLVEKPLCTTIADCMRVMELARDSPGLVWVGLEYRYMPPVAALIEAVDGGAVGQVHMIAMREHRFPFLPKVGDWNRFNRNTGGTLVEKCCHFFDLMTLLANGSATRVMAIGAQSVNHLGERYDGECPDILDNAMVVVEYDNGVRASLDLCMFAEASRNQEELSVVGDAGKVEAFLPSGVMRSGRRSQGWPGITEVTVTDDRVLHEGFHHGSSFLEHLAFLEAVRTGAPAAVNLHDGMMSVALGVAAQRSISEMRSVDVEEVLSDGNRSKSVKGGRGRVGVEHSDRTAGTHRDGDSRRG